MGSADSFVGVLSQHGPSMREGAAPHVAEAVRSAREKIQQRDGTPYTSAPAAPGKQRPREGH